MNDAELAILSIVAEGPIYGYDIQTVIEERNLRDWTNIGKSSMYYVLEKLERQGLIADASSSPAEDTARRQYQITTAGFGVLQTSVADLLSTPREYSNSFALGLVNIHVLRPEQIRTAFTAYRQELISRLGQERERLTHLQQSDAPFNVAAMIEHQIALLSAELDWIMAFVEEWEVRVPLDSPPAEPPAPIEIPRMKQVVLPHDPDSFHRAPTRPLNRPLPAQSVEPDDAGESETAHRDTTLLNAQTPPKLPKTSLDLDDNEPDDSDDEPDTSQDGSAPSAIDEP